MKEAIILQSQSLKVDSSSSLLRTAVFAFARWVTAN